MEIAYWMLGGLLALFYVYAGTLKLSRSADQLRPMMGWVDDVGMPTVRLIGAAEVLAALGLVLPPMTGIAPVLALVAAVGLAVLQVLAAITHLRRGEAKESTMNVVLVVLAAVVGWLATTWL